MFVNIKKWLLGCIGFLMLYGVNMPVIAAEKVLAIQTWKTTRGASVYFVQTTDLPIVDIKIAFQAGSARDDRKPGLAQLTNAMMGQATQTKNTDQIAEALDDAGAIYDVDVDRDMAVLSLRTLTAPAQLGAATTLFEEIVTHAVFQQKEFDRVKRQTIASIQADEQSLQATANNALYQAVFENHPYAHPIHGDRNSVNAITAEDALRFYHRYYVAKNAVMVIVGDLSREKATQLSEMITKNLSMGETAAPLALATAKQSGVKIIHFPGSQSAIRLGQVGVNRQTPDYFSLLVGNYILGGGGLVSRLSEEIREKRGLSYDVFSYFEPLAAQGPFLIALETRDEKADAASVLARQVLKNYRDAGPSEMELNAAKQYLLGSFPLRIDSNKSIAQILLLIAFYHQPLDYLDQFKTRVSQVTTQAIREAFKKHIRTETLVMVRTTPNQPVTQH